MRRLALKAALLALPFALLAAFVFAVDPFDRFGAGDPAERPLKAAVAGRSQYALWKLLRFQDDPAPNILLGDSRMDSIASARVEAFTGERYANLAYGGGTLDEAIDTYQAAAEVVPLEKVYLQLSLLSFNGLAILNRVPEARTMIDSPLLYLSNRLVFGAAWATFRHAVAGTRPALEDPGMSRDAFWDFQVNAAMPQNLASYAFPTEAAARLERMVEACRRAGTELVFVIAPVHVDVQRKRVELGREADDRRFKAHLASLGTVIDLEQDNAFTTDRDNFADPFHLRDVDTVIEQIWGAAGQRETGSSKRNRAGRRVVSE